MSRLCERPGCSEVGAAEYGMIPEDLLFWIAPMPTTVHDDQNVLCLRHADAMSVPRGWTLDDRREPIPRLFKPRAAVGNDARSSAPSKRTRRSVEPTDVGEQLQIDGTGEIERPAIGDDVVDEAEPDAEESAHEPWTPEFDNGDDLDGLLKVSSPLLARAFRGTDRPKG